MIEFMFIYFFYQFVLFDEFMVFYVVSDVCLVSFICDGMNLVLYEYIVIQRECYGVMILFEFIGVVQSFNGSLIVNFWNMEELVNVIYDVVIMSFEQCEVNYCKLE